MVLLRWQLGEVVSKQGCTQVNHAAAFIYWLIVALWVLVLVTVCVAFARNRSALGIVRLLLFVILVDTVRNIIENLYFGLYFGGQYGLLPAYLVGILGNPNYLIVPKIINVLAAFAVFGLLLLRWLPLAFKERAEVAADMSRKTEALHQEIEERQRLFETSLDLILITDRTGVVRQASPSALTTIGYRPDEMIGRSAAEFIDHADLGSTRQELRLARSGQHTRNFETRFVHRSGRLVPLAWSGIWSEREQKYFFVGRDCTERNAAEEQLRYLAHFDQLTGLPNRASLYRDVGALLSKHNPIPSLSVAIFDLDGFKDVNDTLGHPVGDRLLQGIARRLSAELFGYQIYRLGEDEFGLLWEDCGDPLRITAMAETLLKRLAEPFDFDEQRLLVAASCGVAIAPAHGSAADELLANAELALYAAKADGGRSCRLYVPSLRAQAKRRCALEAELQRAYENNEFILYFQPQVRSADGVVAGAEALIRWRHPQRGILAPGAFIDALCESAAAIDVGRWILSSACHTAVSWRKKGLPPIRIGVNLFPSQFRMGALLTDVEQVLSQSSLPSDAVELEITENIALAGADGTLSALKTLRSRGVGIAFDDFGTGYASLSYLTQYPLTRIKIDRSFVQKIKLTSKPEDIAIVRSIIAMGCNLGLQVTAEGVETAVQADFLKSEGCHELQGYLFSQPLPLHAFERFLQSQNRSGPAMLPRPRSAK